MDKEFNEMERLYVGKTEAYEYGIQEHFDRYKFAKNYLKPNFSLLDAACGSGYGTEIVKDSVQRVLGLEVSDHALGFARAHYQNKIVDFKKADLNKPIDLSDNSFDAIVSFETIEHIKDQASMLSEFKRVLRPGGVLVISSPDKDIINGDDKGISYNKFHVNEMSKAEFVALLSKYFTIGEIFGQTKFVILPWYKRLIKRIVKLDVWGIRRKIIKGLGLQYVVHKHFTPMAEIPIEKTTTESPDRYYTLIMVCKNRK